MYQNTEKQHNQPKKNSPAQCKQKYGRQKSKFYQDFISTLGEAAKKGYYFKWPCH